MSSPLAELELARLSALYRYGILDTAPDSSIDSIAEELAHSVDAPIATVTFVDAARLWIKSGVGSIDQERPRYGSLCAALIDGRPILIVPDTLRHPAFSTSSAVVSPPHLRSYAGVTLKTPEGEAIGVVSIAGLTPRALDLFHLEALEEASRQVMSVLDSRRRSRIDDATGALDRAAFLDQIGRMTAVTSPTGQGLSLVLLDLDPLCSHLEARQAGLGRIVQRRMADLGRNEVRRRDSFGRLGDDLFGILLAETDETRARTTALRLTERITQGWSALVARGEAMPVAVGISSMRGTNEDPASLVARAQHALPAVHGMASRAAHMVA